MRNKLRRPLAFLLSAVMIVTMSGTPVHAVADRGQPETGLCEHHAAHTDDCGYTEETPGTPCGHEHTEDCYTEVTECVHEHTPECYPEETEDSVSDNEATPANAEEREPENCPHICDGESGCITEKLDCRHEHDSECGYTESTPGTPCTYVCEICNPQDSGEADEEPETGIIKQEQCSCLTLCTEGQINPDCLVCGAENAGLSDCKGKAEKEDTKQPEDTGICKHHQEHDDACGYQPESEDSEGSPCTYECRICPIEDLIAALPDKVTEDNADEVRAQLDHILALYGELTEDEQEEIDLSRVTKLQGALDNANDPTPLSTGDVDLCSTNTVTLTEAECSGGCQGHKITQSYTQIVRAKILVESGTHNITFSGLNLSPAAVGIMPGGTMNLTLVGTNKIVGSDCGFYVPVGATLVITEQSTGSLDISLGSYATAAGIGGAYYDPNGNDGDFSCGMVVINGGTITAAGRGDSAGIGDASYAPNFGNGGNITITGGHVTATGSDGAPAIGGVKDADSDGSLTLSSADVLAENTTLGAKGTYTINGDPTEDMIVVPELVYTGEILDTSEIRIDDSKTGTATYFGQTFRVQASADGWVLQDLGEVKEGGEYTAVFKKDNKEISKTFTVAQSGTQFVGDGTVKTYKDSTECSDFTADDTITVKATPTATGQAPVNSAMFATSFTGPGAGQMAVFVGNTQVSEAVDAGADGSYTMTVSAADVLTLGGVEPNQAITLTAKFVGNTSMADSEGTVTVNITAAAKVEKGGVTTYYTEFAEAWEKAQEGAAENPATVTLLADVTLTETLTVTSGQNITLTSAKNSDGNDFTMNYAPEKSTSMSSAIEANGGTFELKGGTINVDDESSHGVYVSGGTFKLTGGAIRVPGDIMHGVYVYGGTATISGGAITVNGDHGSGVKVSSGTAIISGGTITANGSVGNGVMVQSGSTAAISGGAITANGSVGNGVNVTSSGTATITGGTITADNRGVDVSSGTATISGGTITADSRGVYVFKGTATISGGTITADSRGVSVSSGTTTITGGTITAGDWGVYASKSTTTITGGTIKSTGGAIYNESGTLLEMLGQTGGSPCAYWQGSEPVALTEGQNELPAGTYTVQKCEHNGKDVCTYTHTSGATTHQKTCLACGNKWDEENCSFDENGKCACEAVLAVALKDNAELTYTGEAQTPEVNVTVDGIALAAEKYQLSYDNNINAGNTAKVTVTGTSFEGTVELSFTIEKATLIVRGNGIFSGTYGMKLSELTVGASLVVNSPSGSVVPGRWALTGDVIPNVGDSGEYTAIFTPVIGAENYKPLTAQVTLEIDKATPPAPQTGTLNVRNGYTVNYPYDLSRLLPILANGQSFGGDVTYTLKAVNITEAGYYDSSDPAAISGTTLTLPVKAVTSGTEGQIGTITVTISSQNFEDMTATIDVRSVNKQSVDISGVTLTGRTYNGSPIEYQQTATASVDGKTVNVNGFVYTWDTPNHAAPVNAGNYTLTVSVDPEDRNYTGSTTIPVVIEQAEIRVTAPSKTIYVGETAPVFSAADCTITGLAQGENLKTPPTVAYADAPDTSKTGTVTVTASGAEVPEGGNYKDQIVYENGTLTITSKPLPPAKYTVTVQAGTGGTASASPSSAEKGTKITLTAKPSTGYHFKEWQVISGGVTISGNSFTMPATNVTVKAVFEKDGSTPPQPTRYSVTVQAGTGGTASASPTSAEKGTKITLTAIPDSGYHFKEWQVISGGVTISNNSFTMPAANVTVKAVFEKDGSTPPQPTRYSVTVQAGTGGTAFASPASAEKGTKITLTATPDSGYHFKGWQVISGGVTISSNSFTMPDTNVTVKAVFEKDGSTPPQPTRYSVTVQAGTGGTASASTTSAEKGTKITLTATPDSGYHFKEWQVISGGVTISNNSFTMPAANVTVKAVFEKDSNPPQPTRYSVTVQDGTGGTASASLSSAEEGTKITLTAKPSTDYHFKEWQVISGGVTISNNSFTMPAANVTVKAVFEKDGSTPPQPTRYSVTVQAGTGGTASASPTSAEKGTKITLTATPDSGYHFKEWQVISGDVTISNNSFTMPAANVTAKAVFERNSNGGGNSGGSGSGGGSSFGGGPSSGDNGSSGGCSTIVARPDETKPEIPTTSQTKPATPDKNGNVAVDNGTVQSAINTAKNDAKKNGNTANGVAVVIPVTPKEGQNSFNVTINAQTLNTLVREKVKRLEINIEGVVVGGMDTKLLKWLDTVSANGDIILRVKQITQANLSKEAKAAIGTRPVYDLSLVYLSGGKETPITDFDGHTIAVRLPYAPAKDEKTGNLYAVYVDGKGKVEWLTKSSYDPDLGTVVFEAGHFSIYGIGYKNPAPDFTDIKNHWAADNIIFVASRGLLAGTGNNQFSPDTGMTRGMFVTALGRLAGIDQADYKTGKFTDVKADAYYAPYVNWAAEKGIVNGTTATTFSPDTNITREQMAVIMANYAKKLGYDLPVAHEAVTFADNAQISGWAAKEVKAMQQAGILAGKGGNRFDPKGTATRAEVATVLRRFVEIVIDPQTAQGWMQNHSGSWQYMKNGKPATGWLQDDKKWYWLDNNGWMFTGGWKQIDGKWYYFYSDGSMAVNTTIDGYTIGSDGARK